jgi:hypothetical protein
VPAGYDDVHDGIVRGKVRDGLRGFPDAAGAEAGEYRPMTPAAAIFSAAQLHRDHHLTPSADAIDPRRRRGSRPVRRVRSRRRRRA